MKKRIYVDMDGVLANYIGRCNELNLDPNKAKHVPGFFIDLKPIDGAIDGFTTLFNNENFDVYILTAASWDNPVSYVEKIQWLNKYLPIAKKRVIFSNQKNFNVGDYLIDDRPVKGAAEFTGNWIHFGTEEFPDWNSVVNYLIS